MKKGDISILLRKFRLMHLVDTLRFNWFRWQNKSINQQFKENNKDVVLPPDYLMYESFQINYSKYYEGGIEVAKWLKSHLEKYKKIEKLTILDWGCGPGRVVRHLPEVFGQEGKYFGTDYNQTSINWCQKNIANIDFNSNDLKPPMRYENESFDFIYGISIFTHLSEELHELWMNELLRVTKVGGILFLTTHGDAFKNKLSSEELSIYNSEKIVIRGNVKEGHRVFTAYHPPKYIRRLLEKSKDKNKILEHIEGDNRPSQDVWLIEKL